MEQSKDKMYSSGEMPSTGEMAAGKMCLKVNNLMSQKELANTPKPFGKSLYLLRRRKHNKFLI